VFSGIPFSPKMFYSGLTGCNLSNAARKHLPDDRNNFTPGPEICICILKKKHLDRKIPWTHKLLIERPVGKFCKKCQKNSTQRPKMTEKETNFRIKTHFSLKRSSGHIDCMFSNFAEKIL